MIIKNYRKLSSTEWIDTKNGKKFSHNQFAGSRFGKDHFYLSDESITERLKIFKKNQNLSNFKHNNIFGQVDLFYKQEQISLAGKKVLVVGGGPSTNLINWKNVPHDFSFACNNFYKNQELKNKKFDFVSFAPFMDLTDCNEQLREYLQKNSPIVGIEPEHSKSQEIKQLEYFLNTHSENSLIYQTKYCSAIGMSTRQAVLAGLLGAEEVYMVGLDLFDDNTVEHAYEKKKEMPRWRLRYGREFQERQVIIFWDYLNNLATDLGCKFYNLSEGISQNHMSFASKHFSPLPNSLKKVL